MRSFISSFDHIPLLRGIVAAIIVMTVAWVAVPPHPRYENLLPLSSEVSNELAVEQYVEHYR